MEMFYLVIYLHYNTQGVALTVIPEKYTKEQCEKAKSLASLTATCILAPKAQSCHTEAIPNSSLGKLVCE